MPRTFPDTGDPAVNESDSLSSSNPGDEIDKHHCRLMGTLKNNQAGEGDVILGGLSRKALFEQRSDQVS